MVQDANFLHLDDQINFYTAWYHSLLGSTIYMDVDGRYRGLDQRIHLADGFTNYTTFSLWDTYRAAHPFLNLFYPKQNADMIESMQQHYIQSAHHMLPIWSHYANENWCMIGYHAVSVMADAVVKENPYLKDPSRFLKAAHSTANQRFYEGLGAYIDLGFVPEDQSGSSVSKTLEYAYDDWCIAQMAKILNKKADYDYFMKRSQSWKNVFDWTTGFMRPKKNGGWDKPFDPREINNNFTEGNSWQYSFFVPQDIQGMIEAYGGPEKFEAKLDEMFNSESKTTGREQVDVTGLIGQYAHGNEPSHHMAYLYNYIGKPEKTKEKVHYILNEFYKNTPDGLIGNEDCGQMSAWYVLSSMGIYAVTPGKTGWSTTEPYFESIKVHLNENKTDYINRNRNGDYLQIFGLEEFQKTPHQEAWQPIIPVPVIEAKSKSFKDQMEISIAFNKFDFAESQTNLKTYYRINNNGAFQLYEKPFTINETAKIEAYLAPDFMVGSDTISATYYKKPNNYSIDIKSIYNPQYHAGGPEGLLDGINGTTNWRKGDWQGYQTQDFEAVIDLQKEQKVSDFHSTFLQDQRSWILMPTKVEYYVSSDNTNFTLVATVDNDIDPKTDDNQIKDFGITLPKVLNARFVKVKAYNYGKLPEWHLGYPYNGDAFIFIDEISIK